MIKRFFICLFICNTCCFALNFGFKSNIDIIKLEDSEYLPDYAETTKTSLFISKDFLINPIFVSIEPSLYIEKDEISFKFQKLKISSLFGNVGISVGKYNNYWGLSTVKNDYFPTVANINPSTEGYWNYNLNLFFNNITLTTGCIFDTLAIDKFNSPQWQSYYLKTEYSQPEFSLGVLCNFYNDHYDGFDFKTTGEFVLTYFPDITIFLDGTVYLKECNTQNLKNEFSFVSGLSYQKIIGSMNIYSSLEAGINDYNFLCNGLISTEVNDFLQLSAQAVYKTKELILMPKIGYEYNGYEFYISCISQNLLEDTAFRFFSIGLSYEF